MNSEQFHRFTAESSSKEILPVLSNASIATCDKAKWQQTLRQEFGLGSTVVCGRYLG